jgi:hypothetical protein
VVFKRDDDLWDIVRSDPIDSGSLGGETGATRVLRLSSRTQARAPPSPVPMLHPFEVVEAWKSSFL